MMAAMGETTILYRVDRQAILSLLDFCPNVKFRMMAASRARHRFWLQVTDPLVNRKHIQAREDSLTKKDKLPHHAKAKAACIIAAIVADFDRNLPCREREGREGGRETGRQEDRKELPT